jgi:hypothetical protein
MTFANAANRWVQDIWPSVSMLWVNNNVLHPMRAAASDASVPA